jgi:hypothetical protein
VTFTELLDVITPKDRKSSWFLADVIIFTEICSTSAPFGIGGT